MKSWQETNVTRVKFDATEMVSDAVVTEAPLDIWLKYYMRPQQSEVRQLLTTMRTPGDDIALVRGWLFTSGLVDLEDVLDICHSGQARLRGEANNRVLVTLKAGVVPELAGMSRIEFANSSCGICGQQQIDQLLDSLPTTVQNPRLTLDASTIKSLAEQLRQHQPVFSQTGGNHAVGLFDEQGHILDVKEDVGRHNAMDKLIGANLHRLPGAFGVLLSGRVSFEMVQKAAMAKIGAVLAIGAPTTLAVECCRQTNMLLAGFIRHEGFNLYSGTLLSCTEKS